jgi:hypothetical protein
MGMNLSQIRKMVNAARAKNQPLTDIAIPKKDWDKLREEIKDLCVYPTGIYGPDKSEGLTVCGVEIKIKI